MGLIKFLFGQTKESAGQLEEVKKVFEKIKANQQKVQKDEVKMQMQIKGSEEVQQQKSEEGQKGNESIKVDQILTNQQNIQTDVAKIQIQMKYYEEILKLLHNSDAFKLKPIRKTIRLSIPNCKEFFAKGYDYVDSDSVEVLRFNWFLTATLLEKGFLGLFLHAKRPNGFSGNFRIKTNLHISILNAFRDKDLFKNTNGCAFNEKNTGLHRAGCGWGFRNMAKLEDLLDPAKGFLRADGSIEVEVDFTIKSATLDHLG